MLKIFEPGPEHDWMLANAKRKDAVRVFYDIESVGIRSPGQQHNETSPAKRMAKPLASAILRIRHGDSFSIREAIEKKWVVVFDLSGITEEAARTFIVLWVNRIINVLKKMHEETGKQYPTGVIIEEAGRLNAITPVLLDGLRTWRKAGFFGMIVDQTGMNFAPEVWEDLKGLSQRRIYHQMAAGVDLAAKDILNASFNSKEEHYRESRQVVDGMEEIRTTNRGERFDHDGKLVGHDTREGVSFRNKYRQEEIVKYKGVPVKEQELATQISTKKTGECIIIDAKGVRSETVRILGEPWSLGLTPSRLARAIQEIRSRKEYQPPRTFSLPTPPPVPQVSAPSSPPTVASSSAQNGTPTVPALLRRRAMLKSKNSSNGTP